MNAPGCPKGECSSPQPEGAPVSAPGRPMALAAASLLFGGCAFLAPPVSMPEAAEPEPQPPAAWQAPPPPPEARAALQGWWKQFDDPVLLELIDAAQAVSPTVAAAASRIEQARASSVAAGALLLPTLDASASATTGRSDLRTPRASFASVNLQAGWELDLFGANQAGRDAALARLQGAQAGWADVRIAVAAETAASYNALRGCEAVVQKTEADTLSRGEAARVTGLAAQAGLLAPASAALARASAAQGRSLLAGQQAQCELLLKSLVALSGIDEPQLRQQLAPRQAQLPVPAGIAVQTVPAAALMQRPDLAAAAQLVVAAAQDTTQAQAQRYPGVRIAGTVGPAWVRVGNVSTSGNLWTIGPVQVSLPLFDGGTREAGVVAARARYDEAVAQYRALVRSAVREVESALVTLDSGTRRVHDTQVAIEGFEASLKAADARFRGGLGSLFDLEDARRSALLAQSTLVELQREQVAAWINLYRALGGGWSPEQLAATAPAAGSPGPAP